MSQDFQVIAENVSTGALSGGVAGASVSVATAVSTTIPLTGRVVKVSASAATTSGSCTLAKGIYDGQEVSIINEGANAVVISGNMSAVVTAAANAGKKVVWSAADTLWFGL